MTGSRASDGRPAIPRSTRATLEHYAAEAALLRTRGGAMAETNPLLDAWLATRPDTRPDEPGPFEDPMADDEEAS